MLLVDSRERKWKHIEDYLYSHNISYKVIKLDVGDYMSSDNPTVSVDRKANLDEISGNLMSGKGNYHRFLSEVKRAKSNGIKLIVLIEGTNCRSIEDVKRWKSKHSRIDGGWLYRQMVNLSYAYGVEWRFCQRRCTAKAILTLLERGCHDK